MCLRLHGYSATVASLLHDSPTLHTTTPITSTYDRIDDNHFGMREAHDGAYPYFLDDNPFDHLALPLFPIPSAIT